MSESIFTRKELYELVWSQPLVSLSKKYQISDVGLRKICIKMNIPLPKAGHWEKIRHGKKVSIEVLPSKYIGKKEVSLLPRKEGDTGKKQPTALAILEKEIENDQSLPLIISATLVSPDKLIVEAKKSLTKTKRNSSYTGVNTCLGGELDISVSPVNIERALIFMDGLIKLLQARGHKIKVDAEGSYAVVNEEQIKISFKEQLKKVMVNIIPNWPSREYHANGILSFRIEKVRHWTDEKSPLDKQLAQILAQLEIESIVLKERKLRWQRQHEEWQEKERIQQKIIQQKEKEVSNFKNLLHEANRWHQTTLIRNYINGIEAEALKNNTYTNELQNWLDWARKKADWYDPQINMEDVLFKDIDKETLSYKNRY
jgi:hypothetical protein